MLTDGHVHTFPEIGKSYDHGDAEILNYVLKDARDLSILWLVEELRNLLQKWFANLKSIIHEK